MPGPGNTFRLSGKVREEGPGLGSGVTVIVHERTTNAKTQTLTGADGSFSLALPRGVYDLMVERDRDAQTASCFYGPLEVTADTQQDFVLKSSAGHANDSLWGVISLIGGQPAAGYKVGVSPYSWSGKLPRPPVSETVTNSLGAFELTVGHAKQLDVELFEADGTPDEHVDVARDGKTVYVELATQGSAVENIYRAGQGDPPVELIGGTGQLQDETRIGFDEYGWDRQGRPPDEFGYMRKGLFPVITYTTLWVTFDKLLPPGAQSRFSPDLQLALFTGNPTPKMAVDEGGFWKWPYAAKVLVGKASVVHFITESDQVESVLCLVTSYSHSVSYGDDRPNVKEVEVYINDPSNN